jgi:hypothetical protein
MQIKLILGAILLILSCLFGVYIGYKVFDNKPNIVVQHSARETVLDENTKLLAKEPDKNAKADMPLPKGATLERIVKFTVKQKRLSAKVQEVVESGKQQGMDGGISGDKSLDELCPPIDISLALITDMDKQQRVEAYSPNGEIVGGIDIPVRDLTIPKEQNKWAIGASYNTAKIKGIWLERDLGRIRLGAEAQEVPMYGNVYTARVGWTF